MSLPRQHLIPAAKPHPGILSSCFAGLSSCCRCWEGAAVPLSAASLSRRPPPGPPIDVEVRLISGELAASLRVPSTDTVASVRLKATGGRAAGKLLHGGSVLDMQSTLAMAGVVQGASLTLVRSSYSWEGMRRGLKVKLDEDGRTIRRNDDFWNAVVVGPAPSRSFRFKVVDNSGAWSGAVELGFTAAAAEELPEVLPKNAWELPKSWIISSSSNLIIDGVGVREPETPGKFQRIQESWAPMDIVQVMVNDAEHIQILANGHLCAEFSAGIRPDVELYPVIGLYGKTTSLELIDE